MQWARYSSRQAIWPRGKSRYSVSKADRIHTARVLRSTVYPPMAREVASPSSPWAWKVPADWETFTPMPTTT